MKIHDDQASASMSATRKTMIGVIPFSVGMDIPISLALYEIEAVEIMNSSVIIVTFTNGDSISLDMSRLKDLALAHPLTYSQNKAGDQAFND